MDRYALVCHSQFIENMKNLIVTITISLLTFCFCIPCDAYDSARRIGEMSINGVQSECDTIVHRKIGPGTTYTCLQFNDLFFDSNYLSYKMRAHVMQIDLTNPYQRLSTCLNTDDYFKASNQVQMVEREKQAGRKPFASSAGFTFQQTSKTDGSKRANELDGSFVIDKKVCYSDPRPTHCFYVRNDSTADISTTQLHGTLTASSGNYIIKQINHCRELADSTSCLSLFCNGMSSWSMNNSAGVDVLLKVVSEDGHINLGSNTCQVISILSGCGHKPEADECIISAHGDRESDLRNFQIGETININISFTDDTDTNIDCNNLFQARPIPAIRDGEVILFNKKSTAYNFFGISQDGKKVFISDLEISNNSNAPADAFAYLMKEIGVYKGNWMDGGPSAEMTVDGEWITVNSIGGGFNGRYIPAALMIYSLAPDDAVITNVELSDPAAKTLYIGEEYAVDVFGYNQYGEMINPHAQQTNQVKVWCDETIGYVDQGNFFAVSEGNGYIYIQVEGQQEIKKMPITVKSNRSLNISPDKLFTGEGRACQLKLFLEDEAGRQEVPAAEAVWHTTSKYVVSSCSDGLIIPYVDGYAEVIADYNGLSDTIGVTVENLEEVVDQLDLSAKAIEMYDKGFLDLQLPSVPHGFGLTVSGTPGCEVVVSYELGNGEIMEEEKTISLSGYESFTIVLDYNAVDTYPAVIKSILADEGSCHIENLTAYYQEISHIDDVSVIASTHYYNMWGQKVSVPKKGMFIKNRKKIVYTPM